MYSFYYVTHTWPTVPAFGKWIQEDGVYKHNISDLKSSKQVQYVILLQ